MQLSFRLLFAVVVILMLSFNSIAQTGRAKHVKRNSHALTEFSRQKNNEWNRSKRSADSVFRRLGLETRHVYRSGQVLELQSFYHNSPLFYTTHNYNAAQTISVNLLWSTSIDDQLISGSGIDARIWDGGSVLSTHRELSSDGISRIIQRDNPSSVSNHSTHISGTMIAAGVSEQAKGMAPGGNIYAYDYNNDMSEIASEASDGCIISNHSYGTIRGWRYNSENEMWYWYGDISISTVEDVMFGYYDQKCNEIDYILYNAPEYVLVKSAGNDRNDSPDVQPVEHYVWDSGWVISTDVRDNDGGTTGFGCLSSMAVAKNVITVGAVRDISDGYNVVTDVVMESYSSWGPTDDGRIKPDIVANGQGLYSSTADGTSSYAYYSGTSMSSASVSGSVILLQQAQELLQPRVNLAASTIKGLLINTADECGANNGPDYKFGWGLINVKNAFDLLSDNAQNGGANIIEDVLENNTSKVIPITLEEDADMLKITLCWTDPEATSPAYELNPDDLMLVNDLDIRLREVATGILYYPWYLTPTFPDEAAGKGDNFRDNVEQIEVINPSVGDYEIVLSHKSQLENLMQSFSVIISGITGSTSILPPSHLNFSSGDGQVTLWFNAANGTDPMYNIYRNDILIANISDTIYTDNTVTNNTNYSYYVTAVYAEGDESIPTNTIAVFPVRPLSLPYETGFEVLDNDWTIKNEITGWRHGDSDALSSYYLTFSSNTGNFLAVDSYSAGKGVHTSDYAISPPYNLSECGEVQISFDYLLVTGIYGAIDELHLLCRSTGEQEWTELEELESSSVWEHVTIDLPVSLQGENIQFALYYDDFYNWGMGAGFDNFSISGTCNTNTEIDLVPLGLESPFSQCVLSANETVSVVVTNNSQQALPVGSTINLSILMNDQPALNESFITTEALPADSNLQYTFESDLNLSDTGIYSLVFIVKNSEDPNPDNDSLHSTVVHYGNPLVSISTGDTAVCQNNGPFAVQLQPEGGNLNGIGLTGTVFYPDSASSGNNEITYSYEDVNGCISGDTAIILVNTNSEIALSSAVDTVCYSGSAIVVSALPAGGMLSGDAVSENLFYPELATETMNTVYYSYTNPQGCISVDSITLVVIPEKNIDISLLENTFCQSTEEIALSAVPSGGYFYGDAVTESIFYPANAGEGINTIYYALYDQCNTDSIEVNIISDPKVYLGRDTTITSLDTILLVPETNGDSFEWYNGATDAAIQLLGSDLLVGSNLVYLTVFNEWGCTASDSILITVEEKPTNNYRLTQNTDIHIYPNPTDGLVYVSSEGETIESIFVYTITGKTIWTSGSVNEVSCINLSDFEGNIFILEIRTDENVFTTELIKY